MENKYIGEKLLKSVDGTLVTYDDWSTQQFKTERQLQYLISDEPRDESAISDTVVTEVVKDLMDIVLGNHDVKKSDIDRIIQYFATSYDREFAIRIAKKLWTYNEQRARQHYIGDIRLSDLD